MTSIEFRPDPQVLMQKLPGGEAVLLHMGTEVYFGLNRTGIRFWEVLIETADREAAMARLLAEFQVDEGTLSADFEKFLGDLADAGLLEAADE